MNGGNKEKKYAILPYRIDVTGSRLTLYIYTCRFDAETFLEDKTPYVNDFPQPFDYS